LLAERFLSIATALAILLSTGGCTDGKGADRGAPRGALAAQSAEACVDGAGQSCPEGPGAVVDDAGRTVDLPAPARRVISLIPATTELIVALGVTDRLLARTDYDTDPALAALPSVGQGLTPSVEWLVSLAPDLVIAWPDAQSRSVVGRLDALGIPTYGARIERIDDALSTIRRIGILLGLDARADSLARDVEAQLAEVGRAVEGRPRPSVFYVVWFDPPRTAGPGTFVDDLITLAGGTNIFADAPTGWPQVGLEEVVRRQPDVVIVPVGEGNGASLERLRTTPGWSALRAVREGRVYEVDAEIFNRPGPRIGEVARRLATLLHPASLAGEVAP